MFKKADGLARLKQLLWVLTIAWILSFKSVLGSEICCKSHNINLFFHEVAMALSEEGNWSLKLDCVWHRRVVTQVDAYFVLEAELVVDDDLTMSNTGEKIMEERWCEVHRVLFPAFKAASRKSVAYAHGVV